MSDEKQKDEICVHCPGSCVNLNASQWAELRGKCRLVSYVSSEIAASESRVRAEEAAKYKKVMEALRNTVEQLKSEVVVVDSEPPTGGKEVLTAYENPTKSKEIG